MGSFQGSKREIWLTKGLSGSTPWDATISRAFASGQERFLGTNGSIAGGMMATWGNWSPGPTKSSRLKTAASKLSQPAR